MPTDLKQRTAEMKQAAEKARDAYPNVKWFSVSDLQRTRVALSVVCSEHVAACDPDSVLALIAEIERLERENAELKRPTASTHEGIGWPVDPTR